MMHRRKKREYYSSGRLAIAYFTVLSTVQK
jgi:hypothetical protein